ncbi:MAG: PorV/PorQ family protein, partial [Crocinitomicaceae bacterium]
YEVAKWSKLKEELTEINIATGVEWWYNNVFAIRGGLFYEARNKGNRQFINLGASLKYNAFAIDFSYLASISGRNSPLANTLRFTLRFNLGENFSSQSSAGQE